MKEIKLWQIADYRNGKPIAHKLSEVNQTETENQLEELIVSSPDLLFNDLKLVGRQTETPGGPLDLLGFDGDGNLVVFELKRGTLTRDAVAQVIDYTSYLSELDAEALSQHITERSGSLGIEKIEDMRSWYQEHFLKDLSTFKKPKMILVGLGSDDRTRRMVSFLANSDIDISLITFYGFKEDGKVFLARHVEVEARPQPIAGGTTKRTNLEKLQKRVKDLGLENIYYEMSAFFRNRLSGYEWPNPGGYSYSLSELSESGSPSLRVYIALYIYDSQPGKVKIYFHPRAVEVAPDAFDSIKKQLGDRFNLKSDGSGEIWVNSKEWGEVQPYFEAICPSIVEGWKRKHEKQVTVEFQEASQEGIEPEKGETTENLVSKEPTGDHSVTH